MSKTLHALAFALFATILHAQTTTPILRSNRYG